MDIHILFDIDSLRAGYLFELFPSHLRLKDKSRSVGISLSIISALDIIDLHLIGQYSHGPVSIAASMAPV